MCSPQLTGAGSDAARQGEQRAEVRGSGRFGPQHGWYRGPAEWSASGLDRKGS